MHKQPGQLVCSNRFKSLGVVEPVESDIKCSTDSEHVDIKRVRENVWLGINRRGS